MQQMDLGMKKAFQVNEWDGHSPTTVAIEATKTYSPARSLTEFRAVQDYEQYFKEDQQFINNLNDWIASLRTPR
jgi:hypothetical protein